MTCCKVILIILFVSFEIAVCEDSHYITPSNDASNQGADLNTTSNIIEVANVTKDKVNITLYYEALCPYCIDFIMKELQPAVETLSSHLNVHLVPYGHAETSGVPGAYTFTCQHGPAECIGNMLHACTVDAVKNHTEAILFNSCLMKNTRRRGRNIADYMGVLNLCGHKLGVLIQPIWDCVNSTRGATLLKEYGDETEASELEFVPYVVLDGTQNDDARRDLTGTVCNMLKPKPLECNDDDTNDTEEDDN